MTTAARLIDSYPFEVRMEKEGTRTYYVLEFVDFDHLIGVGDTLEEAMDAAEKALRSEGEYRKKNGIPMPHPTINDPMQEGSGRITTRIPRSLHRKLLRQAKKDGVSQNALIVTSIAEYLGRKSRD